MIELSPLLAVAALAVLVGAVVQGSVGFGVGMVAAPFLVWALPEAMPATMLLLGGAMPLLSLASEWRHVDAKGLFWALVGRVPGALLGTWLVVTVPSRMIGVIVGVAVIVAAILQWSRWTVSLKPGNCVVAGVVSGVSGTASGIGGPPLAMVYAGQSGPVVRATLAAYFLVGAAISLGTLAFAGRFPFVSLQCALVLLPALVVGALVARPFARHLDSGRTRVAILMLAGVAGAVLTVSSLWG